MRVSSRRRTTALIVIVVLAGLAVAADRVGAAVAAGRMAGAVQADEDLPTRPNVTIHGFPFLTQAFSGDYHDIEIHLKGLERGGVRVTNLKAHLHDVQIPFGKALSGHVTDVPVGHAAATVRASYADLSAALADRGLRVSGAPPLVRVEGTVSALGHDIAISAACHLGADGDSVTLSPENVEVNGVAAQGAVLDAVRQKVTLAVRISSLPFGVRLTGATAASDGVIVTATGDSLVLQR